MPLKPHPTDPDKLVYESRRYMFKDWVELTDEETTKVIKSMPKGIKGWMIDWDLYEFSKAIEAKLKEKNT